MNPPLRSAADREAILEGLADGTIEILCSDHAPHCDYEKEVEFDYAPFGITGLETELALCLMQLYHTRRLDLASGCQAKPKRGPKLPSGAAFMTAVLLLFRLTPSGKVPGKFRAATRPENVPPEEKSLLAICGQKFTRYP